jgi:CRP/FNR family cyclic AMP-dependent transcriptional regulator
VNSPHELPCVDNCLTCHLRRSENFFCALRQKSLEAFNQKKHATVHPEHAAIFVEGQLPRGIFMLCQGQAKLSITSRGGKTFIPRIEKPERSSACKQRLQASRMS